MLLLPPYSLLTTGFEGQGSLHWIAFCFDLYGEDQSVSAAPVFLKHLDPPLGRLVGRLVNNKCGSPAIWLALILHLIKDQQAGSHATEMASPANQFLCALGCHLHQHRSKSCKLQEIADTLQISESRMRAWFRDLTGHALGGYVRKTRLHQARRMLDSTHKSIAEIADATGFASPTSFGRAFRHAFGCAPGSWRKKGAVGSGMPPNAIPPRHAGKAVEEEVRRLQACSEPAPAPQRLLCWKRLSADELLRYRKSITFHSRFNMVFALKGGATVFMNDQSVTLEEGHFLLIKPFQMHKVKSVTSEKICWFFIGFDLENSQLVNAPQPLVSKKIDKLTLECAAEVLRAYRSPGTNSSALGWMAALLEHCFPKGLSAHEWEVETEKKAGAELLNTINNFAHANRGQIHVADKIASSLNMSISQLRKKFKEATGIPLGRHLRRVRLKHARSLLAATKQPVAEAAAAAGYSSVNAFTRAFVAEFHIPAGSFRK